MRKKWVGVALFTMYAVLIFFFSAQDGLQSKAVSQEVLQVLETHFTIPQSLHLAGYSLPLDTHFLLRKLAHCTEYCILYLVFHTTLYLCGFHHTKTHTVTLVGCILFAITDEFHQAFVPGRSACISDICIDTLGAMIGYVLCKRWMRRSRAY